MILFLVAVLSACAGDEATGPSGPIAVSIPFQAVVGSEPFACGASYSGIGTTGSTITVSDFRFYVSDIRLIAEDGHEVALELDQDTPWQHETLALLDFEDGTASCANGTAETRAVVTGTAPDDAYEGLRFTLGVPFELNHSDQAAAPSPLNLSHMFWSWNFGYKFARIDLSTTGAPQGWVIHLGSTGCTPNGSATAVPTSCSAPNRPELHFDHFHLDHSEVHADLAALLAETDVDEALDGSAGCHSGPTDPDCASVLRRFGLPFDGAAPAQAFLSAVEN